MATRKKGLAPPQKVLGAKARCHLQSTRACQFPKNLLANPCRYRIAQSMEVDSNNGYVVLEKVISDQLN
eukprot:5013988-Amphidinium_carterae.1